MQKRILMVGDEPELVSVFRMLCDPTRYDVVFAKDRAAARRALAGERGPDLVVVDGVLADGSGIDLCREIKAEQPSLPVLLVVSDVSRLDEATAAGADMALAKPVESSQAFDAVSWLLERSRERGQPAARRAMDLILVPIDFSPGSEAAAAYAYWLAGRFGARVRLLHVIEGLGPVVTGASPAAWAELVAAQQRVREEARRALGDIAGRLAREAGAPGRTEPDTAIMVASDSIGETIVQAARDAGADLIAMGTHGRSGLPRLVLGSVAEHVVRHAGCPVLTLRGPVVERTRADRDQGGLAAPRQV